ncbi:MerR family transcriptional regulator [Bacillus sp. CGMCC 1.16607]|uniref:MerR family transcriptional regulator n=1 Tax=Bacillus sp. CGMCC 1.16607 TaxID=3351842 RepID=UPI00362D88AC
MLTIGEAAKTTGIPTHTIRYYEKIGLIPTPQRKNGKDRLFSEKEIQFIKFLLGLKATGMSLSDLKEIVDAGCLLDASPTDHAEIIYKRKKILEKHLVNLKEQRNSINHVITQTEEKMKIYNELLPT